MGGDSKLYDVPTLEYVDRLVLQGYDAHWRGDIEGWFEDRITLSLKTKYIQNESLGGIAFLCWVMAIISWLSIF
jgi:hypothetical protein